MSNEADATRGSGRPDDELDRTLPAGAKPKPTDEPAEPAEPAPPEGEADPDATIAGAAPTDPLIGTVLGKCVIETMLGRGAMGTVYRGRQQGVDRAVAIKVMRKDVIADSRALERFRNEARTVGRFNNTHIVSIYDVGEEHGLHYIVMEFVAGKNLREHVRSLPNRRLTFDAAVDLLRQACLGLQEAQTKGVLHRDIKPDNLMLGDDRVLKIADFGIAKPQHDEFQMTMTSELMGTPLYMSPEQCRSGRELDFRSDMYSLGATFFYLLTNEPPARATSVYELIHTKTQIEYLSLSRVLPDLDESHPLSRVIEKMTAQDREHRYASYQEILADLDRVEQGQAPTAEPPPKVVARAAVAPEPAGSRRAGVLAAAALLAVVGGGTAWWMLRSAPPVTVSPGAGNGAATVATFADRLAALRADFRAKGPSKDLAQRAAALDASGADEVAARDAWTAALGRADTVAAELGRLTVAMPELAVPFDALQAWLASVDAATATTDVADPDLGAWLQARRTAVRADAATLASARLALSRTWSDWLDRRQRAVGEAEELVDLRRRLEQIQAGGNRLNELYGADAVPVQDQRAWAKAADDLTAPVVDYAARTAALRAEFRSVGVTPLMRRELGDMQPKSNEVKEAIVALLAAIDLYEATEKNLNTLRLTGEPKQWTPPFDELLAYYATIDSELQPVLGSADEALQARGAALRTAARAEERLAPKAIDALAAAFAAWRTRAQAAFDDAAQRELARLGSGKARLGELYPERAAAIDAAMPATVVETMRAELGAAAAAAQVGAEIGDCGERVDRIADLAAWDAQRDAVRAEIERCAGAVATVAEAQRPALEQTLASLRAEIERRDAAKVVVAAAMAKLGDGDLAVDAQLATMPWPREAAAVDRAATECRAAFAHLRTKLDLEAAGKAFAAARTSLGGAQNAAQARVAAWQQDLAALQDASRGMAVIPGGAVMVDGKRVEVDAFFLGRAEVTQARYAAFLSELDAAFQAANATTFKDKLAVVHARTGPVFLDTNQLARLLRRPFTLSAPTMPVEGLNWYEATAFARWYGQALPTEAEYRLAAFGPIDTPHRVAFGDSWAGVSGEQINLSDRAAVAAEDGGLSWRSKPNDAIHHLAGNVAEWLEVPADAARSKLAGGRYGSSTLLRKQAEGEMIDESKSSDRTGYGFRTVVRVRARVQLPK